MTIGNLSGYLSRYKTYFRRLSCDMDHAFTLVKLLDNNVDCPEAVAISMLMQCLELMRCEWLMGRGRHLFSPINPDNDG